jgi:hypothetical protein
MVHTTDLKFENAAFKGPNKAILYSGIAIGRAWEHNSAVYIKSELKM